MSLTLDDVARIAHLSRLELSADDAPRLQAQLNDFFGLVERMQAVDTEGIAPLAHPIEVIQAVQQPLREDRADAHIDREANQRSAPAVESGLFLVPRVIE